MTRVVGMISGTSADGIDAALLEVAGEVPDGVTWRLLAHETTPHPDGLRRRILAATGAGACDSEAILALHVELGEVFGRAAASLLAGAGVDPATVAAVGSHGQTVWHRPPADGARGGSLQLGDAATIAALTGVAVVSDFRAADLAAGGHGAPLVPWPDRVLLARDEGPRVVLNVGGIANLTWLPPRGSDEPVIAFDTGPGNVLMDAAAALATDGRARCDLDGALAAAGRADADLLDHLLADPFYAQPPPRSTGREHFGPAMVERLAARLGLLRGGEDAWADLLATFAALTAESVNRALEGWVRPREPGQVLVTGGGARNPSLVAALARALEPVPVLTGETVLGPLSGAREAAAFALLAWAHLEGLPGNVPSVTGARGPRVLGSLTPAPAADPAPLRPAAADPSAPA
jgi:anhydro-N-acetylmuramic acid kinase